MVLRSWILGWLGVPPFHHSSSDDPRGSVVPTSELRWFYPTLAVPFRSMPSLPGCGHAQRGPTAHLPIVSVCHLIFPAVIVAA